MNPSSGTVLGIQCKAIGTLRTDDGEASRRRSVYIYVINVPYACVTEKAIMRESNLVPRARFSFGQHHERGPLARSDLRGPAPKKRPMIFG